MEQDIVVERFKSSESIHDLRFTYLISNGDSRVECDNHYVKNYIRQLQILDANKLFAIEGRRLLKLSIHRLTAAAQGAI
ncbi:hypothetical protein PR048_007135 [Dryococelus australis]|uniref:Uncharacterized protein n=1 Tax=Dryococelus australis TaxID=614101 RepID=A0ABQ9ICX0_9NEOP|nr:hypothetical protein PR048_007135 [Dryococelus australis]